MASRELIATLQAEFARFGLTPALTQRSKHEAFEWTSPSGDRRVKTLSNAAEANFTLTLNARADIRRILRADGLTPLAPAQRPPRKPRTDELPLDRLAALEAQVGELTELLLDYATTPPPQGQGTQGAATALPRPKRHRATEILTFLTSTEWTPLAEIVRRSARPYASIVGALQGLLRKGLVENYPRVGWRLTLAGTQVRVTPTPANVNANGADHANAT